MSLFPLFISSDNLIRWDKMQNAKNDEIINDATVTFTLKDSDGSDVANAVDIAMAYVSGSNGRYQGTMDGPTVDLGSPGDEFDLEITATAISDGETLNGFRKIRSRAQYKGAGV